MTKIEKIVLLLAFWTAPVSAAKNATWEMFAEDTPASEDAVVDMISYVCDGVDDVDYSLLLHFVGPSTPAEEAAEQLSLFSNPPTE